MTTLANGDGMIDILMIGLGAIGSFYAFLLERSGKARVTAVCRSNYKIMAETGIHFKVVLGEFGPWKPYRAYKTLEEALEGDVRYDYCINCTKYLPEINPTTQLLAPAIKSGKIGAWVLIQNGLGIEEDLYQAVKHLDTPVLSAVAYIGISTNAAGDSVFSSSQDTLVLGNYPPLDPPTMPQNRKFSVREVQTAAKLQALLTEGGSSAVFVEDRVTSTRFAKNIWNCAWATMEGLFRTTPHTFGDMTDEEREPLKDFIREIVEVGFKSGLLFNGLTVYPSKKTVTGPQDCIDSGWYIYTGSLQRFKEGIAPHKMSMFVDVEAGRPFELDAITGSVLRLGKQYGVSTPLLAFAYTLLKGNLLEVLRIREGKGAKVH